nr:MAG TPA: hypothetical protein [Caudoviricetes sp.]
MERRSLLAIKNKGFRFGGFVYPPNNYYITIISFVCQHLF